MARGRREVGVTAEATPGTPGRVRRICSLRETPGARRTPRGPPLFAAMGDLDPETALSQRSWPGPPGAQGGAGLLAPRRAYGKGASPRRPLPPPAPPGYLQGGRPARRNFPARLRPAPRDAARGWGGPAPRCRIRAPPPAPQSARSSQAAASAQTVRQTLDDDQPCDFFKKRSRVNESQQKSSNMNAGPSRNKEENSKDSSGKRHSKSQVPHLPPQLRSSLAGVSQPTADELKDGFLPEGKLEGCVLSSRCQGASGNRLFLDFQSMKIIKEDADEDSASDLSDSERVPIPPSPLTPPDLNLRAEEIDPVHFDLHPGQGRVKPEYCYPDFLPPPFSSWDLRDMAVLLNTECRTEAAPRAAGVLGRYIDRLVQLEWLQLQTVQWEKGKGARARPPAAQGLPGTLKSPGRSKLIASALSKPLPHLEGPPKADPARRQALHQEEARPSYYAFEPCPPPADLPGGTRLRALRQTPDTRTEEKRKKSSRSTKLQRRELSHSDSSPKLEASGNIRVPKQPATILDPGDSCKTSRTQAHANLKKKGATNNCAHTTVSCEKKLKANGAKQNTYKLK